MLNVLGAAHPRPEQRHSRGHGGGSRIVERYPRIKLTIAHVEGRTTRRGERALLASHPRVWTDLAALPAFFGPGEEYLTGPGSESAGPSSISARISVGTDYPRS
jgi:hypothetical protein